MVSLKKRIKEWIDAIPDDVFVGKLPQNPEQASKSDLTNGVELYRLDCQGVKVPRVPMDRSTLTAEPEDHSGPQEGFARDPEPTGTRQSFLKEIVEECERGGDIEGVEHSRMEETVRCIVRESFVAP